jgi:hypothetical protein
MLFQTIFRTSWRTAAEYDAREKLKKGFVPHRRTRVVHLHAGARCGMQVPADCWLSTRLARPVEMINVAYVCLSTSTLQI